MSTQEKKLEQFDLIMSELGSDEFNALYNIVHRALRIARHQDPFFESDELLNQPAIKTLLEVVIQQAKTGFDFPPTFFHQRIADGYLTKEFWSLDEAASLTVGMDPFYYTLNENFFNTSWRNRRTCAKAWSVKAIRERHLPVFVEGTHYKVHAKTFCTWALATLQVHESMLSFFNGIAKMDYTPCTYGAFGEQLEFDFGPQFSSQQSELCNDTNSTSSQSSPPCCDDGFIGIKEDSQ